MAVGGVLDGGTSVAPAGRAPARSSLGARGPAHCASECEGTNMAKKYRQYKTPNEIPYEEFSETIRDLAHDDGVEVILDIPGVWEHVAEFYNNAAIDKHVEEAGDGE